MLLVNDGKAFLKIQNGNEVQNYFYAFFSRIFSGHDLKRKRKQ